MQARNDPTQQLRDLAENQSGVLSTRQAQLLGLSRYSIRGLVDRGHWQSLTAGIHYLGVGEPPWLAKAWAGILLGGPDARLGLAAAGYAWGILDEPPDPITVLVPATRQVTPRGCWTFPRERPGVRSPRSPGTPPCTTIADTVLDLCAAAAEKDIADLVTRAVQGRKVTTAELRQIATDRARLPHRAALLALLGDVRAGAQSVLELRYLHDVERAHGLPTATRQHRSGGGKEVRDALYEEFATVVELDGVMHAKRRVRDMRRDNRALLGGLATLRYGWEDVTGSPCQVAWEVAMVLSMRGWTGYPTRCPRCAHATDADLWLG